MVTNIFVLSHRPDKYTLRCVKSIFKTATSPFVLNVIKRDGYAAHNKNFILDLNTSDQFIMVNDDIEFISAHWDAMLLETLNYLPEITVAGCRVRLPRGCYSPISLAAPTGCMVDNIRMPDCAIAMKKTPIRFNEDYHRSQCDDICFMLEHIKAGHKTVIDTRITVNHMKVPCNISSAAINRNLKIARANWGDLYDTWGLNKKEFRILKRY